MPVMQPERRRRGHGVAGDRRAAQHASPYRACWHGPGWFFDRSDGRGQCYKMTEELLPVIQEKLDSGMSMYRIAKEHGISQSAITYHIKKGTLKKK